MTRQQLRQRLQKLRRSRCNDCAFGSWAQKFNFEPAHGDEAMPTVKQVATLTQNRRKFASVFCCLLSALFLPQPSWGDSIADAGDLSEFIVNVVRYTSWPSDVASKGLTICFAHGGSLPAPSASPPPTIEGAKPREVRRMPVTWRQVVTPAQLSGCHIVWLHADVRPAPRDWLSAINDKPVLTLSNYADFTADGGIIGAYRIGGEWRFEVSLEALQRSRLNISAVALRLSQKARTGSATGEPR